MKNIANSRKKSLIFVIGFISVISAALLLYGLVFFFNRKTLKFSIDDSTEILLDIVNNDYNSIFDSPTLGLLKELHETYDLDATLFLFEQLGSFNITDFPDKYREEFVQNSDWLKLGWHGIDDGNPEESGYTGEDLIQSYKRTTDAITRFAGKKSLSQELRVHFWYTDGESAIYSLSDDGIKGLYYCDTDVVGYDFSQEEDALIQSDRDGVFRKKYDGKTISYQLTDVRLDNLESDDELLRLLNGKAEDRDIVVFTHAWMLQNSAKYIETVCKWAVDNDYILNWN